MQSPNQSEPIQVTKDELVGALDALDVPYLRGGVRNDVALALAPHELITGFAQSNKARLCYAIIPLLLRHPELAQEAKIADRSCKASRTRHWDFTRQQR